MGKCVFCGGYMPFINEREQECQSCHTLWSGMTWGMHSKPPTIKASWKKTNGLHGTIVVKTPK